MQIKKNIYRSLFISLLLAFEISSPAQVDSTYRKAGVMVGVDLSRFLARIFEPVGQNFEFSTNAEILENWILSAEGGHMATQFDNKNYHYESWGSYFRLGFEYNLLKRLPNENYTLYTGLQYGYSSFFHFADQIEIDDGYWGTLIESVPEKKLTGNWIEIKSGVRVDVLKNIFLGWSVSARIYMGGKTDPNMVPYLIPGYGKGGKPSSFGMSYSILFRIPYKIKIK